MILSTSRQPLGQLPYALDSLTIFIVLRIALITAYFAMLVALVMAMLWSRNAVERQFGTDQAQADWQTWRSDVRDDRVGAGSVERRVPQSPVPPSLALLRDHFLSCLAIAILVSSALYGTFAWMIAGVLRRRPRSDQRAGQASLP